MYYAWTHPVVVLFSYLIVLGSVSFPSVGLFFKQFIIGSLPSIYIYIYSSVYMYHVGGNW